MDLIRILLAFFLPPLGVFTQVGFRGHFWLNILLTLLGWIPGVLHAFWVILAYDCDPFKMDGDDKNFLS